MQRGGLENCMPRTRPPSEPALARLVSWIRNAADTDPDRPKQKLVIRLMFMGGLGISKQIQAERAPTFINRMGIFENGIWPKRGEISRMGPLGRGGGGFLNIAECNLLRPKDGKGDKMITIDKEGILRTADEYEQISLDPGSYNLGKLPYFLKVSKIRKIS